MLNRPNIRQAGGPILLAFGLSLVMAVELAASNGFLRSLLAGTLPWQLMVMVVIMVALCTSAIINAFTWAMRPSAMRMAATIGGAALAMTAGVEASYGVAQLPVLFYFGTSLIGQVAYTYCAAFVLTKLVRLDGRWASLPPVLAASAVAAFGIFGFIGQSWVSLDAVTIHLALARDVALFLVPLTQLGAMAYSRPLKLDPKNARASIILRLPLDSDRSVWLVALAFGLTGLTASFVLDASLRFLGFFSGASGRVLATLSVFSLGWLGLLALGIGELLTFASERRHGSVTAKLATTPAKRFLKRHLNEQQAWAATVGLKTTNFLVDHDPGGRLQAELPASIMQIRAEEIQRCVGEVLGALFLHSNVVGHRIFGAVDPETSVRPCIDTLKMFACLYLDAGPLVERRITGLTALLPIVDPGLGHILKPDRVATLIRRSLWFFHFDFGWIDQHLIHTPRATRYDVRMATLSSRIRHSMLDYLGKTGGVGNFVWIGPEARDRLLQEAPAMRHVIEACPVPSGDGEDELLLFIIKFEQLIPRLQRYFDLDSMRKALLDFEPSPESLRMQNLIGLQIARAQTPEEILDVLAQIASVPWRGFREKDNALQLVLAAHTALSQQVAPGESLSEARGQKFQILQTRILDAVKAVGYPSQILHHAQVNKIALRDIETLKDVAFDAEHPRFEEAWLLMAATDYQRYKPEQRYELLQVLTKASTTAKVASSRLVQAKAVDAFACIGRASDAGDASQLRAAASKLGDWFASAKVDLDICCLLLDAQQFIIEHLSLNDILSDETIRRLDQHFQAAATELGPNHPKIVAVMSRWQELRSRPARTNSAA